MEMRTILCHLLRRFSFELAEPTARWLRTCAQTPGPYAHMRTIAAHAHLAGTALCAQNIFFAAGGRGGQGGGRARTSTLRLRLCRPTLPGSAYAAHACIDSDYTVS